jgi:hypothetical protein
MNGWKSVGDCEGLMDQTNYGKYIVRALSEAVEPQSLRHSWIGDDCGSPRAGAEKQIVLRVDQGIVPGAFYSEYAWLFPRQPATSQPTTRGPEPHTHPFEEVIGCVGTNPSDLTDLGGEVEIILEDRTFALTRSFLVYLPAGMKHAAVRVTKMDRPIFTYVLGSGRFYSAKTAGNSPASNNDLSRQFVLAYKKNLIHPEYRGGSRDEPGRHEHIAYLDREVVPGARFYLEASWFGPKPVPKPVPGEEPKGPKPHIHPFPEIITFFGTNPNNLRDLCGEVELWIDGEQHVMTESFVAYIPANVIHCPLLVRRVEGRMFHFTAGPGSMYV